MKAASRVVVWAILIMLFSLALVLGLILVLLAELYCSLLRRRRQRLQLPTANTTTTSAADAAATITNDSSFQPLQTAQDSAASPLSSFYAQGVLRAPRSFLFPAVSAKDKVDLEKQNPQLPCGHEYQAQLPISTAQRVGLVSTSPPSPPLVASPEVQEIQHQGSSSLTTNQRVASSGKEPFVYISNPIYDNEASRPSRVDTPFDTPNSSPSRLEINGDDDGQRLSTLSSPSSPSMITPPLTPMKKLPGPAEACSVSLRDARSLGTSGSDSNSNNDGISSSSSGSPCTSPSW